MIKQTLNDILTICCEEFGVSKDDVRSPSRCQEFVYCRKAFCLIVKEKFDLKYQTIGDVINRSITQTSSSISKQPNDKFYTFVLARIRKRVHPLTFR
jgi:ATPase involved in DNA replication initiation